MHDLKNMKMGFHTIDKAKKPVPQKHSPIKPLPCENDSEDCPLPEAIEPPHKIFGINPVAFLSLMASLAIGSFSFLFVVLKITFIFYISLIEDSLSVHKTRGEIPDIDISIFIRKFSFTLDHVIYPFTFIFITIDVFINSMAIF